MNYVLGYRLQTSTQQRKIVLWLGIIFNVLLLSYFKYTDFLIANVNAWFSMHWPIFNIILPIGISFFTFTQIAYLIDSYQQQVVERRFVNYLLFVSFFPHLLAGPIIHHAEMMPQFADKKNKSLNAENIYLGLCLFAIGLFKKVVIADYFGQYVDQYYEYLTHHSLTIMQSWTATLSYSVQLYFDFSGYTDMAIGAAMLFNIFLPLNFNSPYKATSIQDFWHRWHMTLSRFLKRYLYIVLGGNRLGFLRTNINILVVFLIGGIWHGGNWTFIVWGLCHGVAYVVLKLWRLLGVTLPKWLSILLLFLFINADLGVFPCGGSSSSILSCSLWWVLIALGSINKLMLFALVMIAACMLLPNSQQIIAWIRKKAFAGGCRVFWR